MKPIPFTGVDTTYAKDQPEYNPLPCLALHDDKGAILICWELSLKERIMLLFTGKLWQTMLTFNRPSTPQQFHIPKPEITWLTEDSD